MQHVVIFGVSGYTLVRLPIAMSCNVCEAHLWLQINVAALSSRYDIDIGDVKLPPDASTTGRGSAEELLDEYSDFGIEVTAPMSCLKDPGKWLINVVHPPLKSYVKGTIAVLGDAVRICILLMVEATLIACHLIGPLYAPTSRSRCGPGN